MKNCFFSPFSHGFFRVAVAIPEIRLSEPNFNAEKIFQLAEKADSIGVGITVFPELVLTGYSNEDLFHQDVLLKASIECLIDLKRCSNYLRGIIIVGCPIRVDSRLYNCAVVINKGQIIGVVPKSYLPNYREFYEKRFFSSGWGLLPKEINIDNEIIPFGTDLLFEDSSVEGLCFFVEICEDVWAPIPPSSFAALAGATILVNLSASNAAIGKADYRRMLGQSQSSKCLAAYIYSAAGYGESTTDLAWDGHGMIWENGRLLAESKRFSISDEIIYSDIDLERLVQERMRYTGFSDSIQIYEVELKRFRKIKFTSRDVNYSSSLSLSYPIARFPFVPSDTNILDERCEEIYNIQIHGLSKRLKSTGIEKVVLGVSGGLDSTQALIVAVKTMKLLGLPTENVLAYTMPGFATCQKTLDNAYKLMKALKVSCNEIDIKPSCMQMFRDLAHPFAEGCPLYDVTFENVQAGDRTSHLFRLANFHNALVLGTGDLSELALGWCTYGVGDHMSHYNVNCSVPKTLIRYLIRWVAEKNKLGLDVSAILCSILETQISPELVPNSGISSNEPAQQTEKLIGPYELHDFYLYYITRFGFRPSKVAYLAYNAWKNPDQGEWPVLISQKEKHSYSIAEIKKWLRVFVIRFFGMSQFKRSCLPNGPKVGSGGSLSPRGDWRAPSDGSPELWLRDLEENVPEIEETN